MTSSPDAATETLERSTVRPVYAFDLDGTILDVNSFPLWVRYLLKGGPATAPLAVRATVAARTAMALVERKALKRSHQLLKLRLQRLWTALPQAEAAQDFTAGLMPHVRSEFGPALAKVAAGEIDALLATAAAEEYAEALAARLGFRHYVATQRGRADVAENVGPAKRTSVLAFVEKAGWTGRPLVVFTDHLEDSPLVESADILVWCGTDADGQQAAKILPASGFVPLANLELRHADVWG
jgi:phosphoserine phosphatase